MAAATGLRGVYERAKAELQVYRAVLRHPRTPRAGRWLLGLAVGYLLLPFDLIPDFIPIVGHLDDAVIVPLLIWLALRMIPADVVAECRLAARRAKLADEADCP